uniref:BTB domain-containing protein n=1 Tax=Oryza barthii TaxID=65489 RepID=A0A0D3HE30_9ORYZ
MTTTTTTLASSAGDVPPPRSASTIVAARANHVLKIDGYSSALEANYKLRSFPFSAGGHTWHINYCFPFSVLMKRISPPHHDFNPVSATGCTDYISFYLFLEDAVDEPVMGQVTFSLLDQDGKPVLSRTHTTRIREDLEQSKHLKDDYFAVSVHLVITKGAPSVKVPPSNLHSHYGDLLSSKQGADVEFMVRGEIFTAHRLVLAARSPAELFGPLKEGTTTDAIQIDGMDAQVFEALLIFIYTDMLPKMDQEDEVAMAQHLLVASDTYGLQRLMLICEDRLCNHINTDSVAIMLVLAEKHHCIRLKEVCFEFLSSSTALVEFMESSDFLYFIRSCPTVLKDLIYNVAAHGK